MVLSRSATTSTLSPVASVAAKTNPPSLLSSAAAAIATTPDSLKKALLVCTTRCNTGWPAGVNLYAFIVPSDSGVTSIT